MGVQKILMPYNFTAHEGRALDFIIRTFAHREDCKITMVYTYTPLPEIDMKASPELRKMSAGLSVLSAELKKKEDGLMSAKKHLLENGFLDDQVDYIFKERRKDIADEIIDTALSGHYDILVLTPTLAKIKRLLARSVHDKVLRTLKGITICLAT